MSRVPPVVRHLLHPAGVRLDAVPPRPSRAIVWIIRMVGPLYRRAIMAMAPVATDNLQPLEAVLADPKTLTFIAFRHPSKDDPLIIFQTVDRLRRNGADAPVFLYGRGVPVWGGPIVAWLLPRIGAISVFHSAINRNSMAHVRRQISSRGAPICLAPEAQVTYHNYRVAPIQRGTASLAIDAATAGRSVAIVPVALEFRYPDRHHHRFFRFLRHLESRVARPVPSALAADPIGRLWWLLKSLAGAIGTSSPRDNPEDLSVETMNEALQDALANALNRAEQSLGLPPSRQAPVDRIFRARQRFWDLAFPRTVHTDPPVGSLRRAMQDIQAVEARIAARWIEMADVLAYLDARYLAEVGLVPGSQLPTAGSSRHARLVEYLLTSHDLANRMLGYSLGSRAHWRGRRCTVRGGTPRFVAPEPVPHRAHKNQNHHHDEPAPIKPSRRQRVHELTKWLTTTLHDLSNPLD